MLFEHLLRITLKEDPASQLRFVDDSGWRLYAQQVADEYVCFLARGGLDAELEAIIGHLQLASSNGAAAR